jgi:hypothetical protein
MRRFLSSAGSERGRTSDTKIRSTGSASSKTQRSSDSCVRACDVLALMSASTPSQSRMRMRRRSSLLSSPGAASASFDARSTKTKGVPWWRAWPIKRSR